MLSGREAIMKEFFLGTGLVTLLIFIIIAGVLALLFSKVSLATAPFLAPALLILLAIPVFVLVFVHAADVFAEDGLADRGSPFGLPAGSMRAFLTAAIVVLVGVIILFLVQTSLNREALRLVSGIPDCVPEEEASRLRALASDAFVVVLGSPKELVKSTENRPAQTCTPVAVLTKVSNTLADDISKQAVVALLTVLASVVSFYFGTRAGEGERPVGDTQRARERAVEEIKSLNEEARRLGQLIDEKAAQVPLLADRRKLYEEAKATIAEASRITGLGDATIDQLTDAAQSARKAVATLKDLTQ
jgi:hypothetical protein